VACVGLRRLLDHNLVREAREDNALAESVIGLFKTYKRRIGTAGNQH